MNKEQTDFLTHFASTPSNQAKALKLARITVLQLNEWICTDAKFKRKYEGIKKEFAENTLLRKVGDGDLQAMKYFLERKGTGDGDGGTPEKIDIQSLNFNGLNKDELNTLIDLLEKTQIEPAFEIYDKNGERLNTMEVDKKKLFDKDGNEVMIINRKGENVLMITILTGELNEGD